MTFSQRIGVVSEKEIQIGSMNESLRNRLYNALNSAFPQRYGYYTDYNGLREYTLDRLGANLDESDASDFNQRFLHGEWYMPYDILEYVFEYLLIPTDTWRSSSPSPRMKLKTFSNIIQETLLIEKAGYRLIDGKFVPITNESEIQSINESIQTQFDSVNRHMDKALALYADRHNPDYENSIKESISAVEAICCNITGLTGTKATLGNALEKLKDSGVSIHGALETAFQKLYGYTSDENGIRHGGIDFNDAPAEDAKYMLVSCSAFVNYLIEKRTKER